MQQKKVVNALQSGQSFLPCLLVTPPPSVDCRRHNVLDLFVLVLPNGTRYVETHEPILMQTDTRSKGQKSRSLRSVGQRHETVNFGVREVKVQGLRRPK